MGLKDVVAMQFKMRKDLGDVAFVCYPPGIGASEKAALNEACQTLAEATGCPVFCCQSEVRSVVAGGVRYDDTSDEPFYFDINGIRFGYDSLEVARRDQKLADMVVRAVIGNGK